MPVSKLVDVAMLRNAGLLQAAAHEWIERAFGWIAETWGYQVPRQRRGSSDDVR
jgi:hypothetical protein